MTVNAICQEPAKDAKTSAGVWSDYKLTEDCAASVTYTGKAGCVAFNGDAVWDAIKPFTGVILILVGGLMTFAGAKFLFQLVSAVVTLVVTIVFYLTISNLFFGL
jgi:Zn-dependent protease